MVKIKAMERVKRPGIFLILWVDSCYPMTSKHRHCFFKGETVLLTCYQWTADQSQGCLSKLGSIPERSLIKIAGVKKATANKTSQRIWKMLLVPYSLQIVKSPLSSLKGQKEIINTRTHKQTHKILAYSPSRV